MTNPAYTIEVEDSACAHCHHGGTWQVLGPNDVALGIAFSSKDEAEEWADELSRAYDKGKASACVPGEPDEATVECGVEAMFRHDFGERAELSPQMANLYRGRLTAALAAMPAAPSSKEGVDPKPVERHIAIAARDKFINAHGLRDEWLRCVADPRYYDNFVPKA